MAVKNFVLGVGIVVVFALVLWQGIEAFYPSPEWGDYCDEVAIPRTIGEGKLVPVDQAGCVDSGGEWTNGYCDYYSECEKEFDEVQDSHSQIVFFISLIVAILAFILGYSLLKTEPVGSALLGSGIWAVFYGTVVNWRNFSDIWRFLILLVVLILLIWLALRPKKKKRWFRK